MLLGNSICHVANWFSKTFHFRKGRSLLVVVIVNLHHLWLFLFLLLRILLLWLRNKLNLWAFSSSNRFLNTQIKVDKNRCKSQQHITAIAIHVSHTSKLRETDRHTETHTNKHRHTQAHTSTDRQTHTDTDTRTTSLSLSLFQTDLDFVQNGSLLWGDLHFGQVLGELRLICNENVHNLLAGLLHILLGFPLVVFPLHRTHVASQRNDVSAQDTRTSCLSWQSK